MVLIGLTLLLGIRHIFQTKYHKDTHKGIFTVAFSAFIGLAVEGMIVDTDHWRHFFIVIALIWGMLATDRTYFPQNKILN